MSTADEIEALREATRACHEAIQAAKDARRELAAAIGEAKQQIETVMAEEVERQVAQLSMHTAGAIEGATQAVYRRFDTITDILLGVDADSKRKGRQPLAKYAEQVRDRARDAGLDI